MSETVIPEVQAVSADTLPVYPPYCVNLREVIKKIQDLYLADKIRRPDEVESYLRKMIPAIATPSITRSDVLYSVKLKVRDKDTDCIYWYEFRIMIPKSK